ncbi:MAG: M48 family metalloprotease [Rhodospirillales bacterium]
MTHRPGWNAHRRSITRRRVVAGLAGAVTTAVAAPALAQFSFSFGGGSNEPSMPTIDLNKVFNMFGAMSLGEEDEILIGNELYGKLIDRNGGAYRNRRVQSATQRFAEDLLKTSERPTLPWEITVVNDNTVNAWVLPGGKIAVNKGLLRYAKDEAELAAVISHEVGHAELAHGLGMMKTERFSAGFSEVAKGALAVALKDSGGLDNNLVDMISGPIMGLVQTGYSREYEDQADRHILKVFGQTGHDPAKAANFFKTLLEVTPPGTAGTTSLFSTHPGTKERIEKIESAAEGLASPATVPHAEDFKTIKRTFPTRKRFRRDGGGGTYTTSRKVAAGRQSPQLPKKKAAAKKLDTLCQFEPPAGDLEGITEEECMAKGGEFTSF